ncbi:Hypothetical protein NTJ_13927 [Nesidiocoris tenuis]|uniref:Uncharacterized protein n=1 Tax=Nesidiocoris tenuis TaxID=355587 RepID=A0ABN7B9Q5_9HEMI|nr:Hypothetical protein NTJ_13927 [Nesidiocoris tenuis]
MLVCSREFCSNAESLQVCHVESYEVTFSSSSDQSQANSSKNSHPATPQNDTLGEDRNFADDSMELADSLIVDNNYPPKASQPVFVQVNPIAVPEQQLLRKTTSIGTHVFYGWGNDNARLEAQCVSNIVNSDMSIEERIPRTSTRDTENRPDFLSSSTMDITEPVRKVIPIINQGQPENVPVFQKSHHRLSTDPEKLASLSTSSMDITKPVQYGRKSSLYRSALSEAGDCSMEMTEVVRVDNMQFLRAESTNKSISMEFTEAVRFDPKIAHPRDGNVPGDENRAPSPLHFSKDDIPAVDLNCTARPQSRWGNSHCSLGSDMEMTGVLPLSRCQHLMKEEESDDDMDFTQLLPSRSFKKARLSDEPENETPCIIASDRPGQGGLQSTDKNKSVVHQPDDNSEDSLIMPPMNVNRGNSNMEFSFIRDFKSSPEKPAGPKDTRTPSLAAGIERKPSIPHYQDRASTMQDENSVFLNDRSAGPLRQAHMSYADEISAQQPSLRVSFKDFEIKPDGEDNINNSAVLHVELNELTCPAGVSASHLQNSDEFLTSKSESLLMARKSLPISQRNELIPPKTVIASIPANEPSPDLQDQSVSTTFVFKPIIMKSAGDTINSLDEIADMLQFDAPQDHGDMELTRVNMSLEHQNGDIAKPQLTNQTVDRSSRMNFTDTHQAIRKSAVFPPGDSGHPQPKTPVPDSLESSRMEETLPKQSARPNFAEDVISFINNLSRNVNENVESLGNPKSAAPAEATRRSQFLSNLGMGETLQKQPPQNEISDRCSQSLDLTGQASKLCPTDIRTDLPLGNAECLPNQSLNDIPRKVSHGGVHGIHSRNDPSDRDSEMMDLTDQNQAHPAQKSDEPLRGITNETIGYGSSKTGRKSLYNISAEVTLNKNSELPRRDTSPCAERTHGKSFSRLSMADTIKNSVLGLSMAETTKNPVLGLSMADTIKNSVSGLSMADIKNPASRLSMAGTIRNSASMDCSNQSRFALPPGEELDQDPAQDLSMDMTIPIERGVLCESLIPPKLLPFEKSVGICGPSEGFAGRIPDQNDSDTVGTKEIDSKGAADPFAPRRFSRKSCVGVPPVHQDPENISDPVETESDNQEDAKESPSRKIMTVLEDIPPTRRLNRKSTVSTSLFQSSQETEPENVPSDEPAIQIAVTSQEAPLLPRKSRKSCIGVALESPSNDPGTNLGDDSETFELAFKPSKKKANPGREVPADESPAVVSSDDPIHPQEEEDASEEPADLSRDLSQLSLHLSDDGSDVEVGDGSSPEKKIEIKRCHTAWVDEAGDLGKNLMNLSVRSETDSPLPKQMAKEIRTISQPPTQLIGMKTVHRFSQDCTGRGLPPDNSYDCSPTAGNQVLGTQIVDDAAIMVKNIALMQKHGFEFRGQGNYEFDLLRRIIGLRIVVPCCELTESTKLVSIRYHFHEEMLGITCFCKKGALTYVLDRLKQEYSEAFLGITCLTIRDLDQVVNLLKERANKLDLILERLIVVMRHVPCDVVDGRLIVRLVPFSEPVVFDLVIDLGSNNLSIVNKIGKVNEDTIRMMFRSLPATKDVYRKLIVSIMSKINLLVLE